MTTAIDLLKEVHESLRGEVEINERHEKDPLFKKVSQFLESTNHNLQPFGEGKATNEPVSFENRLNQYEAIIGFVQFLTTKTSGIVLASGHNPGNVDDLIVSFCIANNFPKPKAGWEKMLRFPE